nr:undecaprenyl-diphosphate phosphatase [Wigglesworthia glossinidia]
MKQILISIVLGIVEGITEFLPISSSGHLILMNFLFNINLENIKNLAIMIQIGPVLSLFLIFKNNIKNTTYYLLSNFNEKKNYSKFLYAVF